MKPEEKALASRYAEGLYSYCREEEVVEDALHRLEEVVGLLQKFPEAKKILANPNLLVEEKAGFLRRILGDELPEWMEIFLTLLLRRHRFELLGQIAEEFRLLWEKEQGMVRVEAHVPIPIPDDIRRKLVGILEQRLKKKIIWKERVDRRVVGGIAVLIGDRILDDTLRHHLDELKRKLLLEIEAKGG